MPKLRDPFDKELVSMEQVVINRVSCAGATRSVPYLDEVQAPGRCKKNMYAAAADGQKEGRKAAYEGHLKLPEMGNHRNRSRQRKGWTQPEVGSKRGCV